MDVLNLKVKPIVMTSGVEVLTGNPIGEIFSILIWVKIHQAGCILEIRTLYCVLVIP